MACCTTITHAILLGGIINGRSYARKNRILLVRRLDEAATKKAMKPLFQIEHEWEFSRNRAVRKQKMASRMLFLV